MDSLRRNGLPEKPGGFHGNRMERRKPLRQMKRKSQRTDIEKSPLIKTAYALRPPVHAEAAEIGGAYRRSFQNRNAARRKAPVNSPFHGETALPAKAVTSWMPCRKQGIPIHPPSPEAHLPALMEKKPETAAESQFPPFFTWSGHGTELPSGAPSSLPFL